MNLTQSTVGDTPHLEIALLRRSLGGRDTYTERCDGCHRAMLIGEKVYEYESGALRCELCRDHAHADPLQTHTVHTAAAGNSIRVIDRRAARRAA